MAATVCSAGSTAPAVAPEHVLMDGRVDEAIHMLQTQIAANPNDGDAHLLLCRAFYSEQQTDSAVHECELAVNLMPRSSNAQDWMGRAYGVKANGAGPLTGLRLARRVHDSFESAVALDPRNVPAVNDLAEYYVGAPSLVGGGLDKASALAAKVEPAMPQMAHRIRALVAEKSSDYGTAEREFKAAASIANAPDAWVDLGGFYKRRKQNPQAIDALQHAFAFDKLKDAAIVDVASYLMDLHTQPDISMKALQQYLGSSAKSDDAPVIRVHTLIASLMASDGDKAGAKAELNKALSLAANYAPAKRALQQL